jgi:ABC-type branched-subunit amino acid transport system ATPase component
MEGGRTVLDGPAVAIAAERRVMEAYLGAGRDSS